MSAVTSSQWDDFLARCPSVHILQTTAWGELKSAFGWQVHRLIVDNTPGRRIGVQILFRPGPLGLKIAYLGRGPVTESTEQVGVAGWRSIWPAVDELCRQQHAIFLLFEPDIWEPNPAVVPDGFIPSIQTIQPPRTIVVDLHGGEENILQRMKQKTRYNIRLAEKKGVTVSASTDLEVFYRLIALTGQRDGFGVHSLAYFRKAHELYYPSGNCELFIADYQGEPLAGVMVFAHRQRAWYFHGASSDRHRDLMPSYLVQWQAIRWAVGHGCLEYDLWGVPDADQDVLEANFQSRSDGLWGVYRFKRGFGGQLQRTAGPWDRVFQPWAYAIYKQWLRMRQGRID